MIQPIVAKGKYIEGSNDYLMIYISIRVNILTNDTVSFIIDL